MQSNPLDTLAALLLGQRQLQELDLCLPCSMIEGWGASVWPALAGQLTSLRLSLEPHLFSNDGELPRIILSQLWGAGDGGMPGQNI